MQTNFSKAWIEFRKSEEYSTCYETMKAKGFKQRYVNNILWVAFTAGWGKKKIVIINQ